ncbi:MULTISPECIES: HlyD family secretion protein [unclassified Paraflavitalea]|uniref:HlyD family secretion protein n=1 Tax=unclassified Paraflavitalea TaxID=2798305 RepID=UPI003D32B058
MEGIRKQLTDAGQANVVSSFSKVYRANRVSNIRKWFLGILIGMGLILLLPWTQNIRTRGDVTALRQEQRPQELNTIIAGRIVKWNVKEGDFVKKGDTIAVLAEIKDDYLDPALLNRTEEQLESKKTAVESYRSKVQTVDAQIKALENSLSLKVSEIQNKIYQQRQKITADSMDMLAAQNDYNFKQVQFKRQKALYDSGLVSLLQLEQRNQAFQDAQAKRTSAEIKFGNSKQEMIRLQLELNGEQQQYLEKISKASGDRYQSLSQIATGAGEIAKLENQYTNYNIRSGQYYIKAPQDGQVVRARKSGLNEIVKEGEMLVEIVPANPQLAVELYVKPVDLPLVDTGQRVRFIFDGFPAIVFSGWPQASYGTFSGKVVVVENGLNDNGLFRVLVVEDPNEKPWPKELKMGTGASGFALLKDVPIWYELWRNINGFPPEYYKTSKASEKTKK